MANSFIDPLMDAFKKYPLLGAKDATALIAIAGGVASAHPAMNGNLVFLCVGAALTAFGVSTIIYPRLSESLSIVDKSKDVGFVLPSDDVYDEPGILLGYTKDDNRKVVLPFRLQSYHMSIIGASGYGKTTLLMGMLYQQVRSGGGFIFGDAKIDADTRDTLGYWATKTGRANEFYIINFDDPSNGNTYNPALEGDADEVSSRLMNVMPESTGGGADHYRSSVQLAITIIIAALKSRNIRYTFSDLSILMQSSAALEWLLNKTPEGSSERMNLEVFLNKFRKVEHSKDGTISHPIDENKIKDTLGGLGNRIGNFAQGKMGEVMNTYTPEIDLYDIIMNNKMLYVMLPTMAKNEQAIIFMKMFIGDLRSAVSKIQKLPKTERPQPTFMVPIDEFGPVATESIATLFEQARSAGLQLMPGFQTFGQLDKVGESFDDILLQNTTTKAYFKFGVSDSAERAADNIGHTKNFQHSITSSQGEGDGAQTLRATPQATLSANEGSGDTWRTMEEHKIRIDQLKGLDKGEAIITIGPKIYHVQIPMLYSPIDANPNRKPYTSLKHPSYVPSSETCADLSKKYKSFVRTNEVKKPKDVKIDKGEESFKDDDKE